MNGEPTSDEEAQRWVDEHLGRADPYRDVARATAAHRESHGCDAFESGDGALLGVLARAAAPRRVLEVGTALGYSALWLAHGAGRDAVVHTLERDPVHADLARAHFAARSVGSIEVLVGDDLDVLSTLQAPYDMIFYDANVPTVAHLAQFDRLLSGPGLLVTSNLFLGRYAPDLPNLAEGARYREAILDPRWLTSFVSGKALTVRR